eukprot:CAMPEP_0185162852 /NCGR_PEP_ID=MMETSP1139-20130426/7117_1 /TAXON_ID=298111 /ORGANISM="Pavlova sp., Strain CCMP459" /LENGTH=147 /DNA_ID=CAMNT_0027728193 /DNA_START=699 /DNA_END=1144 /DNA_ORIENTATION=-
MTGPPGYCGTPIAVGAEHAAGREAAAACAAGAWAARAPGAEAAAVDRRGVMGRLAKAGGRGVEAAGRGQVLGVHGGCFCCGRREGAVGRLVALLRPDEVELPAALVLLLREDTHLAEALASAARVALAGDLGLVALLAGLLSKATRF